MKRLLSGLAALVLLLGAADATRAGPMVFETKPYESFADSPFFGQSFSYFHLETFEEGALTAPGVTASTGFVVGPSSLTDSVEPYGTPNLGSTFFSGYGAGGIMFTFDAGALGQLPTHAAIAWTDGDGPNRTFKAFDASGNLIDTIIDSSPGWYSDGDGDPEHFRLFGAIDSAGIKSIFIANDGGGIEVDHLQYGFQPSTAVPEPASLTLLGLGALGLAGVRAFRRHRRLPRSITGGIISRSAERK